MSSTEPLRPHRILRQHVLTDRLLGVQSLPIGEVAIPAQPSPQQAISSSPPATTGRPVYTPPARSSAPPAYHPSPTPRMAPAAPPSLLPAGPRKPVGELPDGRTLSRDQRLTVLQAMDNNEVKPCTRCVLHQGRTQTVFGEGNPTTDLMFIGEGPGEKEDRTGRPFVGPAGELLGKMITAMGLSREEVYIANAVKCRPPGNRTPTPEETHTCGQYLTRQIAIIRPKVIVTLGGPATKYILDTQVGITALRGRWMSYDGLPDQDPIPVMPTFHPAYLLRAYTVDNRKKVWSDLQAVMDKLKGA